MNPTDSQTNPGYERRDVDVFAMAMLAILFLLCGAVVHLIVAGFLQVGRSDLSQHAAPLSSAKQVVFPEPRLQVSPRTDLSTFRAREEALLNTYGWVDRKANRVRLPIDKAMQLLAERGLPQTNKEVTPADLQRERAGAPSPTTEPETKRP